MPGKMRGPWGPWTCRGAAGEAACWGQVRSHRWGRVCLGQSGQGSVASQNACEETGVGRGSACPVKHPLPRAAQGPAGARQIDFTSNTPRLPEAKKGLLLQVVEHSGMGCGQRRLGTTPLGALRGS